MNSSSNELSQIFPGREIYRVERGRRAFTYDEIAHGWSLCQDVL